MYGAYAYLMTEYTLCVYEYIYLYVYVCVYIYICAYLLIYLYMRESIGWWRLVHASTAQGGLGVLIRCTWFYLYNP